MNQPPAGYHSINPYLFIKHAAEAIDFYKRAFGAEERMRLEMPDGRIGHAEIVIGGSAILLADEFPEWKTLSPRSVGGTPVAIHLFVTDVDDVFQKALDAGATQLDPVETKFYGDRSGCLKDPYGHMWYVSTRVEDVSQDEMQKRLNEMLAQHTQK